MVESQSVLTFDFSSFELLPLFSSDFFLAKSALRLRKDEELIADEDPPLDIFDLMVFATRS